MAFIPLPFHPENTVFERRGWTFTSGHDDLKMQAVSRLMLDNIEHIKAYWIMISTPLAQVALHFGANDIQGTVDRGDDRARRRRRHADRGEGRLARARDPRGRAHPGAARLVLQRRPPLRLMLRLGRVSFINTFPVEWALARHLDPDEVEEVAAVPTELNRMLAARRARRRQRLERRVRATIPSATSCCPRSASAATAPSSRCSSSRSCRCRRCAASPSRATRRPRSRSCRCSCPTRRSCPRARRPTPAC